MFTQLGKHCVYWPICVSAVFPNFFSHLLTSSFFVTHWGFSPPDLAIPPQTPILSPTYSIKPYFQVVYGSIGAQSFFIYSPAWAMKVFICVGMRHFLGFPPLPAHTQVRPLTSHPTVLILIFRNTLGTRLTRNAVEHKHTRAPEGSAPRHLSVRTFTSCAAYNYSSCITYLPSVHKGFYKKPRIDRNAAKSQWPSEIKRAPHNTTRDYSLQAGQCNPPFILTAFWSIW